MTVGPARPAGRPREFDPEDKAADAVAVFWECGYRATTTRRLEAELEVNQAGLYRVFGSKEGLLEAALTHYETFTEAELLGPLREGVAGLEDVARYFTKLQSSIGRGCLLVSLMGELGDEVPSIVDRSVNYRGDIRTAFAAALSRAAAAKEISAETVAGRAGLLTSSVLGLNIAARSGATPGELAELFENVRSELDNWSGAAR